MYVHQAHTAKPDRKIASNIALELSNGQIEGSSIETAPNIVKDWLGDRVSELEGKNVSWSFKNSGEDHIVVDIDLQDQANLAQNDLVPGHLTMQIHKTIRDHKLGDQYVDLIHKSADLWEKNLGRELFRIQNYIGFRTSNLFTRDNISMIFYGYFDDEYNKNVFGRASRYKGLDITSLIFNFKIRKKIVESDILMNGNRFENRYACLTLIARYTFSFTSNLSNNRDKCSLALFWFIAS